MPAQSHVLSFNEASRASYSRADRRARSGRNDSSRKRGSQGSGSDRFAQEHGRSGRSATRYASPAASHESPLSWESLSLSNSSSRRASSAHASAPARRQRADRPGADYRENVRSSSRRSERGSRIEQADTDMLPGRSRSARTSAYAQERPHRSRNSASARSYAVDSGHRGDSAFSREFDFEEPRSRRGRSEESEQEPAKLSLMDRMKKKRHDRRKAKAGRKFAAQFEDAPSDASRNAPRAALYTGSVGTKQREAMNRQRSSVESSGKTRKSFREWFAEKLHSPRALAVGAIVICVVAVCAFMYPNARQYYLTVRQNAQLEAEYQAIQERNGILQREVNSLSSDEGIADRAHELYGWVGAADNAVLIQGIEHSNSANANGYTAAIAPDSVPAPETWYSPVLDWVFGYESPSSSSASTSASTGNSSSASTSSSGQ